MQAEVEICSKSSGQLNDELWHEGVGMIPENLRIRSHQAFQKLGAMTQSGFNFPSPDKAKPKNTENHNVIVAKTTVDASSDLSKINNFLKMTEKTKGNLRISVKPSESANSNNVDDLLANLVKIVNSRDVACGVSGFKIINWDVFENSLAIVNVFN